MNWNYFDLMDERDKAIRIIDRLSKIENRTDAQEKTWKEAWARRNEAEWAMDEMARQR